MANEENKPEVKVEDLTPEKDAKGGGKQNLDRGGQNLDRGGQNLDRGGQNLDRGGQSLDGNTNLD